MDLVEACQEADGPLCRAVQARMLAYTLPARSDNPLQAQMQFLVGQATLDEKGYEQALESFTRARDLTPSSKVPELDTISLVRRLLECVSRCSRFESDIWMEFRLIAAPYPSTNMRDAVRDVPNDRSSRVIMGSVKRV